MDFKILTSKLLRPYTDSLTDSPLTALHKIPKTGLPADYFQFYKSVASVYSSKTEGEDIDFDSFFKHKFLNVLHHFPQFHYEIWYYCLNNKHLIPVHSGSDGFQKGCFQNTRKVISLKDCSFDKYYL